MLEYKKGRNFLFFPYGVRKFHSVFGWKCIRYSQQQYNNREERRMNKWKKLTSLALVGIMAGSLDTGYVCDAANRTLVREDIPENP